MIDRADGAEVRACTDLFSKVESGSKLSIRTVESSHPTAKKELRTRPSGTSPKLRHVTVPAISRFSSYSASDPSESISKYTISPELSATATCLSFVVAATIDRCCGAGHSLIFLSARMCLIPLGCTWIRASSPSCCTASVGAEERKPVSVTSSTVSPMLRTRVPVLNERTMYASYSSPLVIFVVHTASGLSGSSDSTISETDRPCFNVLKLLRAPEPHME